MRRSLEQKVEELSKLVGGRFKLTTLVQKRLREYHMGGRAFMPDVPNLNALFELVLQQVEHGEIDLDLEAGQEPDQIII